nr:hypothetical protein GCM10020093_058870 [Planobispora longispora]
MAPRSPSTILDLSRGQGRWAAQAARAGHRVVEVIDFRKAVDGQPALRDAGKIGQVRADDLRFLPDGSVDAVLAEDRAMSLELMAESAVADIARVLRPGGRALICVDSLVLGMAILAEQNYWAHLRQTGEVMLVPWPDGSITRCFSSGQLRELLTEAGLEVEWIRPRTVLSPPRSTTCSRPTPARSRGWSAPSSRPTRTTTTPWGSIWWPAPAGSESPPGAAGAPGPGPRPERPVPPGPGPAGAVLRAAPPVRRARPAISACAPSWTGTPHTGRPRDAPPACLPARACRSPRRDRKALRRAF